MSINSSGCVPVLHDSVGFTRSKVVLRDEGFGGRFIYSTCQLSPWGTTPFTKGSWTSLFIFIQEQAQRCIRFEEKVVVTLQFSLSQDVMGELPEISRASNKYTPVFVQQVQGPSNERKETNPQLSQHMKPRVILHHSVHTHTINWQKFGSLHHFDSH